MSKLITIDDLLPLFKMDREAVGLCLDLLYISHIWDDLVDRDKPVSNEEINAVFRTALIDIPSNPFFDRYKSQLLPLMLNTIMVWQSATAIERDGNDDEKVTAFMMRNAILNIFHHCLFLVGGWGWAEKAGPDLARLLAVSTKDKLDEFMKEFEKEVEDV